MASKSQANVAPIPAPALEPAPRRPFSDEALLLTDAPVPGRIAPPAIGDLQAEVITDWSQLEALEQEWQELASAAAEPNAFYEPWMVLPALRAYRSPARVEGLVRPYTPPGPQGLCGVFPLS